MLQPEAGSILPANTYPLVGWMEGRYGPATGSPRKLPSNIAERRQLHVLMTWFLG